jgi:hypothetical protein
MSKSTGAKDFLIQDFTPGQRDYILQKVYPILKKSLIHFVSEAQLNDEITDRPPTPGGEEDLEGDDKLKLVSIFQVYPKQKSTGAKRPTTATASTVKTFKPN